MLIWMNWLEIQTGLQTRGTTAVTSLVSFAYIPFSVSSAIVQRYLQHILEAALSQNAQIQNAAIDVLTFTIKQGLAHPLQVCALVRSPSRSSHAFPSHSQSLLPWRPVLRPISAAVPLLCIPF